jgi:hypothetical protein
MTSATELMTLPKGCRILGMDLTGTASNAGTTAVLSIGKSGTNDYFIATRDVKTAATGTGTFPLTLASDNAALLTQDTKLVALYAETGTASAAGAWTLNVRYTIPATSR